jgi:hypothetical protein
MKLHVIKNNKSDNFNNINIIFYWHVLEVQGFDGNLKESFIKQEKILIWKEIWSFIINIHNIYSYELKIFSQNFKSIQ